MLAAVVVRLRVYGVAIGCGPCILACGGQQWPRIRIGLIPLGGFVCYSSDLFFPCRRHHALFFLAGPLANLCTGAIVAAHVLTAARPGGPGAVPLLLAAVTAAMASPVLAAFATVSLAAALIGLTPLPWSFAGFRLPGDGMRLWRALAGADLWSTATSFEVERQIARHDRYGITRGAEMLRVEAAVGALKEGASDRAAAYVNDIRDEAALSVVSRLKAALVLGAAELLNGDLPAADKQLAQAKATCRGGDPAALLLCAALQGWRELVANRPRKALTSLAPHLAALSGTPPECRAAAALLATSALLRLGAPAAACELLRTSTLPREVDAMTLIWLELLHCRAASQTTKTRTAAACYLTALGAARILAEHVPRRNRRSFRLHVGQWLAAERERNHLTRLPPPARALSRAAWIALPRPPRLRGLATLATLLGTLPLVTLAALRFVTPELTDASLAFLLTVNGLGLALSGAAFLLARGFRARAALGLATSLGVLAAVAINYVDELQLRSPWRDAFAQPATSTLEQHP
ncbi:MAG: hypothetical protein HYV63_23710 [Candidatus Schekmanbacteria bacterium]|nr:hypothetical protein [Candidatus Schekmanbacteria bacterium]